MVDDASFGGASWFPAANAIASDDMWAVTAPGGSPTHYLKATNFAFAIPAPAQILGIEVLVERHSSVGTIFDSRARIVKGGVIGTAERALAGTWPTVTDATVTYGSPSDLWGETWTPADINGAGFGFALSVDDNADAAAVDHISIRVSYSLCASTPAIGCRTAAKSILVVKDNATDTKDKLIWKWIKGASTTQAEFGDPTVPVTGANIALCVYDNTCAARRDPGRARHRLVGGEHQGLEVPRQDRRPGRRAEDHSQGEHEQQGEGAGEGQGHQPADHHAGADPAGDGADGEQRSPACAGRACSPVPSRTSLACSRPRTSK